MKDRIPNLNGIRFIGAFLIALIHFEIFKSFFLQNELSVSSPMNNIPYLVSIGEIVMKIFFILSSFLISISLINEKNKNNQKIHFLKFYIKRLVRILPLYFLLVGFSFIIAPNYNLFSFPENQYNSFQDLDFKIWYFVFLIPEYLDILGNSIPYAQVLWSVGIELIFYFFAPFLLLFKKRSFWIFTILTIVAYVLTLVYLDKYRGGFTNFQYFVYRLSISSFLIGTWGAKWVTSPNFETLKITKIAFSYSAQALYFTALFIGIIYNIRVTHLVTEFYALIILLMIVNLGFNKKSILKINSKFWELSGNISYGFYIVHTIVVTLVLKYLIHQLTIDYSSYLFTVLGWTLSITITYIISCILYYTIEQPVNNIRKKLF